MKPAKQRHLARNNFWKTIRKTGRRWAKAILRRPLRRVRNRLCLWIKYRRHRMLVLLLSAIFVFKRMVGRPQPRAILFHPQMPAKMHIMWKLCRGLGISPAAVGEAQSPILFCFEDKTFSPPDADALARSGARRFINRDCVDISKHRVGAVFEEVFGYSLDLDPTRHEGPCVQKSDLNYAHDGVIVDCPIAEPEEGFVYQRLIDNRAGDGLILDIRTLICGQSIPFLYMKYRKEHERFSDENEKSVIKEAAEVFSKDEVEKILAVAKLMKLEFGGLDVLRDNQSGKIYIVDVNNTCGGPPGKTPVFKAVGAMLRLGRAFRAEFLG